MEDATSPWGTDQQGLPADGVNETCRSYDYYATSFAIPFYSLIYARLQSTTDPETATRYRDRARRNLIPAINLFAPNGACIPFGRSMTYRFACSSIFAAVAFDGLEVGCGGIVRMPTTDDLSSLSA